MGTFLAMLPPIMGKGHASRPFASLMGLSRGSNPSRVERDRDAMLDRCEALADCCELSPTSLDPQVVLRKGREALLRYPEDVEIQVAVGRLLLAVGQLEGALHTLSGAARLGAGARTYRLLGETLLRLGDAQIAKAMLKRAIKDGEDDPETRDWYESAKAYAAIQTDVGCEMVAREVARTLDGGGCPPPPVPFAARTLDAGGCPPPPVPFAEVAGTTAPEPSAPVAMAPVPEKTSREPSLPRFPSVLDEPASAPAFAQPPLPLFTEPTLPESVPAETSQRAQLDTDVSSVCTQARTRSDAPCTIDLEPAAEVDFDLDVDELQTTELVQEVTLERTVPPVDAKPAPEAPTITPPAAVIPLADSSKLVPSRSQTVDMRLWEANVDARPMWKPRASTPARSSRGPRWKRGRVPVTVVAVLASALVATFGYVRFGARVDVERGAIAATHPEADKSRSQSPVEAEAPAPPAATEAPAPVEPVAEPVATATAASAKSASAAPSSTPAHRAAAHSKPAAPAAAPAPAPAPVAAAPRATATSAPRPAAPAPKAKSGHAASIWPGDPEAGGN